MDINPNGLNFGLTEPFKLGGGNNLAGESSTNEPDSMRMREGNVFRQRVNPEGNPISPASVQQLNTSPMLNTGSALGEQVKTGEHPNGPASVPPPPPPLPTLLFAPPPPAPPMLPMKPANPTGNSKPSSSMANLLAASIKSKGIETNTAHNSRVSKDKAKEWSVQKAQLEAAEAKRMANEAERIKRAENAARNAPNPGQLSFGPTNLAAAMKQLRKTGPVNKKTQTPNVSGSQTSPINLVKAGVLGLRRAVAGNENEGEEEEEW
jgi:hypothetical protein